MLYTRALKNLTASLGIKKEVEGIFLANLSSL